nr:MarR family EPS-associated transcriptional regulator [Janthinobacterium sp. Marseille]
MNNSTSHEENHLKVLRLLEGNPHMNQRDLADSLGVSLGKVNYCIKALIDKGLIKIQNFRSSNNKLAYAYLLTPLGITEKANLTGRFLKYKLAEYERLNAEIQLLKREIDCAKIKDLSDTEGGPLSENKGSHA